MGDYPWLSGWWFGTCFLIFHNIWDVILPIDELHHFSRWLKRTTNQLCLMTGAERERVLKLPESNRQMDLVRMDHPICYFYDMNPSITWVENLDP